MKWVPEDESTEGGGSKLAALFSEGGRGGVTRTVGRVEKKKKREGPHSKQETNGTVCAIHHVALYF